MKHKRNICEFRYFDAQHHRNTFILEHETTVKEDSPHKEITPENDQNPTAEMKVRYQRWRFFGQLRLDFRAPELLIRTARHNCAVARSRILRLTYRFFCNFNKI